MHNINIRQPSEKIHGTSNSNTRGAFESQEDIAKEGISSLPKASYLETELSNLIQEIFEKSRKINIESIKPYPICFPSSDYFVQSIKCTRCNKQNIGGINWNTFSAHLSGGSFWYINNSAL